MHQSRRSCFDKYITQVSGPGSVYPGQCPLKLTRSSHFSSSINHRLPRSVKVRATLTHESQFISASRRSRYRESRDSRRTAAHHVHHGARRPPAVTLEYLFHGYEFLSRVRVTVVDCSLQALEAFANKAVGRVPGDSRQTQAQL